MIKAIFCALYFGVFTCMALAGDVIKYRSPDGKFGMLLSETEGELGITIKLIEISSRKIVLDLADSGHPYSDGSKLLWSPDSTKVAFLEGDRRGGSTTVYRRSGDMFEKIVLPETPDCKNKKNIGKEFAVGVVPKRWIGSNTLLLLATNEWTDADDSDKGHQCEQTVRVIFDSAGNASAKLVKETQK